ncbi:hypothetical protein COLO4_23306 [Corchorus olitorius]|uniref:Uncharacterized protein n=1 Tax=Corchorus olitorius TaxID=93759 RepID=A0A1R3IHE4_9ROSI|nr:hypothetical protein COLO4_23306 [Corchorus olitorius]
MCGGAIIAEFIPPRNRGRRVTASDIWPDSPFSKFNGFSSDLSQPDHDDSLSHFKRSQPQPSPNPNPNISVYQQPARNSHLNGYGFNYDLNEIGGYATDPIVISGEENSGSGSEGAYSVNQNLNFCYTPVKAEEEEKREEPVNKVAAVEVQEEANEVQKLSEELMAYENFMKFYQLPYLDGQSPTQNAVAPQESVVGELWSFDDDGVAVPVTSTAM